MRRLLTAVRRSTDQRLSHPIWPFSRRSAAEIRPVLCCDSPLTAQPSDQTSGVSEQAILAAQGPHGRLYTDCCLAIARGYCIGEAIFVRLWPKIWGSLWRPRLAIGNRIKARYAFPYSLKCGSPLETGGPRVDGGSLLNWRPWWGN